MLEGRMQECMFTLWENFQWRKAICQKHHDHHLLSCLESIALNPYPKSSPVFWLAKFCSSFIQSAHFELIFQRTVRVAAINFKLKLRNLLCWENRASWWDPVDPVLTGMLAVCWAPSSSMTKLVWGPKWEFIHWKWSFWQRYGYRKLHVFS